MRRLHVQIFLTFVGIVALFAVVATSLWWVSGAREYENRALLGLQALVEEVLPAGESDPARVNQVLARFGQRAEAHLTLRAADGRVIGAFGPPLPDVKRTGRRAPWLRGRNGVLGVQLSDGRRVIARPLPGDKPFRGGGPLFLIGFVLALVLGAYPLARRLTRRLERLQRRVEELGAGDLSARVQVEGRDEVAALAQSFNRSAEQIQALVEAQKRTLAAASHELRTPLARLRMAFELLERPEEERKEVERKAGSGPDRGELRARVQRDIADLDDLIEEILLTSRLDSARDPLVLSQIDLLGLAAEEAARFGLEAQGRPASLLGDERLLRRLLRNLLENAERHGGGATAVVVQPTEQGALLRVVDRGPGVADSDREVIFQPFHRQEVDARRGVGAGLGLSLVRRIARLHGGEAVCRSGPGGEGACFEIRLRSQPHG